METEILALMPCPYFEPQRVASDPRHAGVRLPLLEEYDGVCHALGNPLAVAPPARFQSCNHGYSRGSCERFPVEEVRSGIRYTIARQTEAVLEIVCIEEQDYAPLRWHSVQYSFQNEQLSPELSDPCIRAQILAFCRSFRRRFCG